MFCCAAAAAAATAAGPVWALLAGVGGRRQKLKKTRRADGVAPAPRPPGAQAALLDSLYGTERGLAARSEVRAEINELIAQLEAANPTASPAEATEMLAGNWKLARLRRARARARLPSLLAAARLPHARRHRRPPPPDPSNRRPA